MSLRLVAFVAFCAYIQNTSTQTVYENPLQCASNKFRCYTGQCIDNNLKCDGVANCADGSDEFPFMCGKGGVGDGRKVGCRPAQYRCSTGQCIDGTKLCDGNVDCLDRSDETSGVCSLFSCYKAFRCTYGACIDEELKCDGVANCVDGSDEDPKLCSSGLDVQPSVTSTEQPSSERPPILECPLPQQPQNGRYEHHCFPHERGCDVSHGRNAAKANDSLLYTCDAGYKLSTSRPVHCNSDGTWSVIAACEEVTCPPLASPFLETVCTRPNSERTSCDAAPVPRGTQALLTCLEGYELNKTEPTTRAYLECNSNGQWQPSPMNCMQVCGRTYHDPGKPLITNGALTTVSEFPWHGTLYHQIRSEILFSCGATIIKDNMLVSAAHCVYNPAIRESFPPEEYYVAVGNAFRDYDDKRNDLGTFSNSQVKRIRVHDDYLGVEGNYMADIAILVIDKPITFTERIMPICLDKTGATDWAALEVGNYGRVPGFGRTASGDSSPFLQGITVPYVSRATCKQESAPHGDLRYVTLDKFCAGYTNGTAVCDGDSGGGLVFKTGNRWYLRGIVSLSIGASLTSGVRTCNSYTYSLYTRVASHMGWILDVIREESN